MQFAGFLWLQIPRYVEDEVRCVYEMEPAGAAAWDYDVYVEPDFRFGKAFVRLWDAAHRASARAWHRVDDEPHFALQTRIAARA